MLSYNDFIKHADWKDTTINAATDIAAGVGGGHLGGAGAVLLAKLLGSKDPNAWWGFGMVPGVIGGVTLSEHARNRMANKTV